MEKTIKIMMQELREQIAQRIEDLWPCFCGKGGVAECQRCTDAKVARGEK
jgi:hypothetical protein